MNKRILPQRRRWIKQEERKQMQKKSASSFFGILTIIDLFISLFVLICSEHHECLKILEVTNDRNKLNFKLRNKLNKHNKDNKLNFNEHLKGVLDKMSKSVGLIRKFQPILPRFSLLTIYKTFVRPHLNYGDIIYDQTYNASFDRKHESIEYSACLAITGVNRGILYEKLNQELRLETHNLGDCLGSYVCSTKLSIINHLLTCSTIFLVLTKYTTRGI